MEVKSKALYCVLHLIHAVAISLYSFICIVGLIHFWYGTSPVELSIGLSFHLLFITIGLLYIIIMTGGEIDKQWTN